MGEARSDVFGPSVPLAPVAVRPSPRMASAAPHLVKAGMGAIKQDDAAAALRHMVAAGNQVFSSDSDTSQTVRQPVQTLRLSRKQRLVSGRCTAFPCRAPLGDEIRVISWHINLDLKFKTAKRTREESPLFEDLDIGYEIDADGIRRSRRKRKPRGMNLDMRGGLLDLTPEGDIDRASPASSVTEGVDRADIKVAVVVSNPDIMAEGFEEARPASACKVCAKCGTTDTPQWRRGANTRTGYQDLCNRCGVEFSRRKAKKIR